MNVGSGGGAAAAPAAGGAPTGGAAAAEEPAAKEEEKKEEGRVILPIAWTLLTPGQKRKNPTKTWALVFSTRNLQSSSAGQVEQWNLAKASPGGLGIRDKRWTFSLCNATCIVSCWVLEEFPGDMPLR